MIANTATDNPKDAAQKALEYAERLKELLEQGMENLPAAEPTKSLLSELFSDAVKASFEPAVKLEILARKKLLNSKEVAQLYGIGAGTLDKRRMTGEPPTYRRIGGSCYYTHEDIIAFVESCKQKVRVA